MQHVRERAVSKAPGGTARQISCQVEFMCFQMSLIDWLIHFLDVLVVGSAFVFSVNSVIGCVCLDFWRLRAITFQFSRFLSQLFARLYIVTVTCLCRILTSRLPSANCFTSPVMNNTVLGNCCGGMRLIGSTVLLLRTKAKRHVTELIVLAI